MKSNLKAKLILIALTLSTLTACIEKCKSWGDYKLGGGYSLMSGDGDDETILIVCTSDEECCHAGIELVPQNVSEIASDSWWIVARTSRGKENGYWVIRKTKFDVANLDSAQVETIKSGVHGPMQHDDYLEWLDGNGITLRLEKFKWF